ncbi:713_t:CDS:2, partial [Acaulospora colombiana]
GIPDIIIRSREEYLTSFEREKENTNKPVQSEIRPINKDPSSHVDSFAIPRIDENSLSQEGPSAKSNNSEGNINKNDSMVNGPYSAHPEISSDDDEEIEADEELRKMLAGLDIPKLPSLWDPELKNPDRDKFFESGYDS